MSQNLTSQIRVSTSNTAVTKKELQEHWKQLKLKPATLLHLQEVLDRSGSAAAALVTEVVVREKERQARFTVLGKEWGSEMLRLLSLEGIRPHLLDVLRMVLESFLAWHLISLPILPLDTVVEFTLAALFLLVSLLGICLMCQLRRKPKQQKKSS